MKAFANHKGILVGMSNRRPGAHVLAGRFNLKPLVVNAPKVRSAAAIVYEQGLAADADLQPAVQRAAPRAGLRRLAPAMAR